MPALSSPGKSAPGGRRWGRVLMFRIASALLALMFCVVVLEVALRLLGLGYGHSPDVGHPVFHHWNPTDYDTVVWSPQDDYGGFSMHFNSAGCAMSGELPPLTQPSLVFLGDSFTLARQVREEKRFANLVGEQLGMPVVNLGNGSACPLLSRLQLEWFADRISPAAVVYQLYSNDITGERDMRKLARSDAAGRIVAVPGENTPIWVRVGRAVYVVRWMRMHYLAWQFEREMQRRGGDAEVKAWAPLHPKPLEESYPAAERRQVEESILELANICRARNWPFFLCVIPDRGALLEKKPDHFADYFQQFAEAHNLNFIDLASRFRSYPPRELFFRIDIHLTETGHRAAAEAIAPALSDSIRTTAPVAKLARAES